MARMFKQFSLVPKPLRYKLMIAFSLMSIIPMLICGYLSVNFIFPKYAQIGPISLVIFITLIITMLGFHLAKEMIEPIVQMAIDARRIAGGDLEHSIAVTREDEIGDLGKSLNVLTQRIKDNINELKNYGERTKEINIDINKKVMALSGLLQISSLISSGTDIAAIMDMLAGKVSYMEDSNPAVIMVLNEETNVLEPIALSNVKSTELAKRPVRLGHGLVGKCALELKDIVIDKDIAANSEIDDLRKTYEVKNAAVLPIIMHDKCKGVLLTGNKRDFYAYSKDDMELLKVFVKQAAIALENDALIKKAEELEVIDELTGLYNENYIKERLEEEIKRSMIYQRPCSFVILKVADLEAYCGKRGRMAGEAALKKIAKLISEGLTAVDKAARFADDEFAIVLPERNRKEGELINSEIRKKISELVVDPKAEPAYQKLKVCSAISENPIDGASANELILVAHNRLKDALKGANAS
ncbi:MAG: sensor domain-containing diguanylate cyclase [Candidatus Omnitrophica bacterium]|nr:sensor domain-containing diguanylate cyclase [Candidatus Omnitrophota bacterium]